MRNIVKAALFTSAFSPALISVGVSRLLSGHPLADAIYYILAGLFGCLTVVIILLSFKKHGESFPFRAKKIESNDAILLSIVVTYIVPFFARSSDLTASTMISIFLAGLAFFSFTDTILPSPLLRLISYRFYKIENDKGIVYTVISNRDLLDTSDIKVVKQISSYMLLEVKQ